METWKPASLPSFAGEGGNAISAIAADKVVIGLKSAALSFWASSKSNTDFVFVSVSFWHPPFNCPEGFTPRDVELTEFLAKRNALNVVSDVDEEALWRQPLQRATHLFVVLVPASNTPLYWWGSWHLQLL